MIKVCFLYDFEGCEKFLKIMSKMTPGRSGKWKDMVAVTDPEKADFQIVIDETTYPVDPKRVIYVGAHPHIPGYRGWRCFDDKPCVAKLDLRDTFGFGEWWLSYDYDYLSVLEPMPKTKDLCCIMSDQHTFNNDGREKRVPFLKRFCGKYTGMLNLYGRIKPDENLIAHYHGELGKNTWESYWFGKEDTYRDHRYAIEIDVGLTKNYFSERFFDAMLMWCMPIYWGGTTVHEWIPENAFRYFDIDGYGDEVAEIVNSDFREQNIEAMREARDILLNKLQLWARVYQTIKSL